MKNDTTMGLVFFLNCLETSIFALLMSLKHCKLSEGTISSFPSIASLNLDKRSFKKIKWSSIEELSVQHLQSKSNIRQDFLWKNNSNTYFLKSSFSSKASFSGCFLRIASMKNWTRCVILNSLFSASTSDGWFKRRTRRKEWAMKSPEKLSKPLISW